LDVGASGIVISTSTPTTTTTSGVKLTWEILGNQKSNKKQNKKSQKTG
jgi:hypothetical protein